MKKHEIDPRWAEIEPRRQYGVFETANSRDPLAMFRHLHWAETYAVGIGGECVVHVVDGLVGYEWIGVEPAPECAP